ncbi:cobalamin biosynthesis protein [Methylobacterium marchantiae]|uniref:Cobalamin biosynthesis protein n=1 Tax=Methylobacterium marchantiae TaxID=600331 RepID=A0ABW3WT06_9HYPH
MIRRLPGTDRVGGRLRDEQTISGIAPLSRSSLQEGGDAISSDQCRHIESPDGQERRSLVAGIGFRHGAGADEIIALIRRALAESAQAADRLAAIATAEDRVGERPIREAAAAFGIVPTGISPSALTAVDRHVPTRSIRIEASRNVGSVAEAAALAAAGDGGILILPRIASPAVTCALALPVHFATQAP